MAYGIIGMIAFLLAFPSPDGGPAPRDEYATLLADWKRELARFAKGQQEAPDADARKKVRESNPKPVFQERFMDFARRHPKDPATVDALVWVLVNPWYGKKADENHGEATAILTRDFLEQESLANPCWILALPHTDSPGAGGLHPGAEALLRKALAASPHRKVRGAACYSLASYLKSHSRWKSGGMTEAAASKMKAESEARFEQVIAEYGDLTIKTGRTLRDMAESELNEMRNLVVGKPVPEIDGEDLEGRRLRLSEYRGKVVVLTFWATWCGPCMAQVPHELELTRRMAGRPFAIVGVNGDEDHDAAVRRVAREGISWRSWRAGSRDGEIVRRWNVHGWPTVYVIDAKGIIRSKNPDAKKLDEAVEALVAEAMAR